MSETPHGTNGGGARGIPQTLYDAGQRIIDLEADQSYKQVLLGDVLKHTAEVRAIRERCVEISGMVSKNLALQNMTTNALDIFMKYATKRFDDLTLCIERALVQTKDLAKAVPKKRKRGRR